MPVNSCVRSNVPKCTQKSLRERSPSSGIKTNPLQMHGGRLLGLLPPLPPKLTEVECIESNETWQASKLINYLFIGVHFILCDCYCDVICDVQIWHRKKFRKKVA